MPAEPGPQITSQHGLGSLESLSDPKRIGDRGPASAGMTQWGGIERYAQKGLGSNIPILHAAEIALKKAKSRCRQVPWPRPVCVYDLDLFDLEEWRHQNNVTEAIPANNEARSP
jgi:hypothetical protein